MSNTLFMYMKGTVSNADDTDPETSSSFNYPPMSSYQNVVRYQRRTATLDEGEELNIDLPDFQGTMWIGVTARVVGYAKLETRGTDWAASAITGETYGYGTQRYPGYIALTTTNTTSFKYISLADGTTVESMITTLVTDDQL